MATNANFGLQSPTPHLLSIDFRNLDDGRIQRWLAKIIPNSLRIVLVESQDTKVKLNAPRLDINPSIPHLSQSKSKAEFFRRLAWNDDEFYQRIYQRMMVCQAYHVAEICSK